MGRDADEVTGTHALSERERFEAQGYDIDTIEQACEGLDELSGQARAEAAARIFATMERDTLQAEVERLRGVIRWALGEEGEFPPSPEWRTVPKFYYWRKELRSRAFPSAEESR